MSIKVTIGVCTKNSERTIKETIDSIASQQYPAELIQLIVVDGCSRDKTLSIVTDSTRNTRMKVEIYSDEGRGLGAARQTVVDKAIGKYIVFADADVKLFDDFLKMHVKFMEENPSIGVAFGKPMYQEGQLVFSVWNLYQYATGGFPGNDATIYRPEVLRNVGSFDSNIKGAAEDTDLLYRIQTSGFLVSVNEQARWLHKNRDNLKGFLAERSWMGYGGHYFLHKINRHPTWHDSFIAAFGSGLKTEFIAYRRTHRKLSFLIPLQLVLGNIFWWFGFFKGHIDGYGHKKSVG